MREDVIKYEAIMDEQDRLNQELSEILDQIEANQENYQAMKAYYGSEEYMKDVDISNSTEEYSDISCGILSEDAAFDTIVTTHDLAIRLLEVATNQMKQH